MNTPLPKAGRIKEVTSVSNPLIKKIRGLDRKKNRDETGVFLAEGLQLVTFAIENGWTARTLIYAKTVSDQSHLQSIAAKSRARGCDILEVSEKVLGAITRRDNPQMVVAVLEQQLTDLETIKPRKDETWVALDRVRDPGNLGTILRSCDAVGASGVILVGDCTDPFSIEAVRATMGSLFNVKVAKADAYDFHGWSETWKSAGGRIVGTHLEGSTDYRKINYNTAPTLLLMGNEQQGLPDNLVDACDDLALIPMMGRAESLNLAIATGIMLFEIRRSLLVIKKEAI